MDYFDNYDSKYPYIVYEILDFFDINNPRKETIGERKIADFCELHYNGNEYIYQPQIVSRICKRLMEFGIIELLEGHGALGLKDCYYFMSPDREKFIQLKDVMVNYYNSIVYGFNFIYDRYRSIVVPIVGKTKDGKLTVGTGFKFWGGIVTARHCLDDVICAYVEGYDQSIFRDKKIYVSENEGVDIAFIDLEEKDSDQIITEDAKVMQEVLVLGYPKIPTFDNFLTSEKAMISSKAKLRLTPTRGDVSAIGKEYITDTEALLITAKIRGGNSGGPVINATGSVVGVACRIPNYGDDVLDYDDLGYGIAMPVSYLRDIFNKKSKTIKVDRDFFKVL